MNQKYSIISRKQDIGQLINQLHREEFLAVGIMDTGTPEDLLATLDWFVGNFNYCLHVVSQTERFNVEDVGNIVGNTHVLSQLREGIV